MSFLCIRKKIQAMIQLKIKSNIQLINMIEQVPMMIIRNHMMVSKDILMCFITWLQVTSGLIG